MSVRILVFWIIQLLFPHNFPLSGSFFGRLLSCTHIIITLDIVALTNGFPQDRVSNELRSVEIAASAGDTRVARLVLVFKLVDAHTRRTEKAISLQLGNVHNMSSVMSQAEV